LASNIEVPKTIDEALYGKESKVWIPSVALIIMTFLTRKMLEESLAFNSYQEGSNNHENNLAVQDYTQTRKVGSEPEQGLCQRIQVGAWKILYGIF
jgi:hypothetical protein